MGKFAALVVALLLGAAAALGLGFGGFVPGLTRASSGTGSTDATSSSSNSPSGATSTASRVVALARLEPASGIIELAGIPGDRVEVLSATVGQTVRKDDELIRFESFHLRQWEQAAAKSQLAEATARLQAEQAHADVLVRSAQLAIDALVLDDLELTAQRTRLRSLAASVEIARRDYERVSKLDAAVASKQELEHSQLMRDRAEIELTAAQEQIKKLESGRDLRRREAEAGLEQAKAARAKIDAVIPLESLRIAINAADEKLRLAALRAPSDGTILEVFVDSGDAVAQAPLLRLADTSAMIARAEVYETQINRLRIGQTCQITADALAKPLTGVVEKISTVVGRNRLMSLDPRRSTDDRIVEVIVRVNEPAEAARLVNLQTLVTIETGATP